MENKVRILVELGMPNGSPSEKPAPQKETVEEQVRQALECIESGHDSRVEWITINRIYKYLTGLKRPSARANNLLRMLSPVLSKYGYHGVSSGDFNSGK